MEENNKTVDASMVPVDHVRIVDFRIAIDFIADQLKQGNRVSAICAVTPIDNDDYGPVNIEIC
jgi:hypothetical protein